MHLLQSSPNVEGVDIHFLHFLLNLLSMNLFEVLNLIVNLKQIKSRKRYLVLGFLHLKDGFRKLVLFCFFSLNPWSSHSLKFGKFHLVLAFHILHSFFDAFVDGFTGSNFLSTVVVIHLLLMSNSIFNVNEEEPEVFRFALP